MHISAPPRAGSGALEAAHALLSSLIACGLRHLVLAPGSRSAPLAYAASALAERTSTTFEVHVRHDERSAAFTALGLSRAGELAAVGTTSGTATAHLLAAAMEAHHSGIPLVLLTADRPAELRGTGANQTTYQAGLFSPFTVLNVDLPAPGAHEASHTDVRLAVDTAARAAHAALESPGPVHLNLGFRDPLAATWASAERVEEVLRVPEHAASADRAGVPLRDLLARTVVVAGDGYDSGRRAAALATRLGLPLFAEPSSNARACADVLVPMYPEAIAHVMSAEAHELRPRTVIVVGHPTLSRPVMRQLLGASDIEVILESSRLEWPDAPRNATRIIPLIDVETSSLAEEQPSYLDAWRELGRELDARSRERLAPQAVAALAVWEACAQDRAPLVLGASSLIRDLEQHAGSNGARVHANRGLAGIDGTVSMASGIALAERNRTRVLLGDVSAIHDLTGFVIGPTEREPELDIVIVDDNGGRIFSGLEHQGAPSSVLERFFTTPHGVDLASAIEGLGVQVERCAPGELSGRLSTASHNARRRVFFVDIGSERSGNGV